MKKYLNLMILIGLCLGLSIAVFLFFKAFSQAPVNAFKDNSYTTEIMAAFLGTVFTIIITAILLRTQSVMEERRCQIVVEFLLDNLLLLSNQTP